MFSSFRNLSENAQRLLCIYAYSGMESRRTLREIKTILNAYYPDFPINSDEAEVELKNNNMFERMGFSWYANQYNYGLTYHTLVPALWYALQERQDLIEKFKKARLSTGFNLKPLREAMIQLVRSNYTTCSNAMFLRPEDTKYLAPICMVKNFKPLFDCMAKEAFEPFFIKMIYDLIENDIVAEDGYLLSLLEGNTRIGLPQNIKLKGYVDLYNYIASGKIPQHTITAKDFAGLTLLAIGNVLNGKYTEAVKTFQLAMKIHNKNSNIKNMYTVSLLNYYYILAFCYEGSQESKNKLNQFLNKREIPHIDSLIPSRIIAGQTLGIDSGWHKEAVKNLLISTQLHTTPRTIGHLAFLIDKYFEFHIADENETPTLPKPRLKLLRHELSDYIDISENERVELQKLYGERPGLTSHLHKADWELSLEHLLLYGTDKETIITEKDTRLMYHILNARGEIEVREQTRLKNGSWGSGKAISNNRLRVDDPDSATDSDIRILNRFRNSRELCVRIEHVIEEMVEESRLYAGRYSPYTLVNVTEDKPYIIVEKHKNGFYISSNIPHSMVDDKIIVLKENDKNYSFIKIPDHHRALFKELFRIGVFPLKAEETLRAALTHIGGTIEIHSELIEGGSTLPSIQGSPLACIQLSPTKDGFYDVNISAHPLADGRQYFSLGKGDAKYVDEHEGERVWVERDISEEKNIANLFRAFFKEQEDNPDTDFHDSNIMLDMDSHLELDPVEMLTLLEFIQTNPEKMYAEWPEGKKSKIRYLKKGDTKWTGTLHERGMWFQLEGDIQIDDDTVLTMAQLLELVSISRGKYIKLGDGDFLALSDTLHRQLKALEAISNREKDLINISPFSAALLSDDIVDGDIHIFMSQNLLELRKRILDSANYKPDIPKELTATLRPYQIDGYQWMARLNSWGAGALLADDMGLGKTVQTIAFLLLKAKEGASLVIAPASVAPNWKIEFDKFAPSLNATILNYTEDRKKTIEEAGPNDVIITTYAILLNEQDNINSRRWNIACLDEAHIIKNRGAKTSAAAMKIQADNKVILTGTPVQNHLSELWSLFQFINPGLLGRYDVFSRKFITPIERDQDRECQKRLDRIVHPFMLRRTKQAVLQELPEKTEIYQRITLSKEEMAAYEIIRNKAEKLLQNQGGTERIDFNVLAEITRLRQAACSTRLIESNWTGESSKVTALYELLLDVIEGGNRALVFSQFTSFFDIVREKLDKEGIKYFYIDGSIPVKKRTELVDSFQNGGCPIFLISLKAGGLGLNLTNANYVFHLDPWWNPAIEQQATDRAYRIGQRQAVTVYHLISENTIEEKIIRLHQTKRDLAENILEGTDISHKLTGKDLLEMVAK